MVKWQPSKGVLSGVYIVFVVHALEASIRTVCKLFGFCFSGAQDGERKFP
jgi:hypothetical protein